MQYRKNEYTVFLSYYGSFSPHGTKGLALQAKKIIDKTVEGKSYCGPDEDDHTFLQHMNEVIPSCSLFLLIVNDSCPQTASGAIANQAAYMIKEIQSFLRLVQLGERNPKDFAVLYVGNLLSGADAAANFARTLLRDIDPNHLLSNGNHHFILDFDSLSDWIRIRLDQPAQDLGRTDEERITFLHDEVDAFLQTEKSGMLLIEMPEGTGKTTFIRQREIAAKANQTERSVFLYVNSENNYSQLIDFPVMLYQKLSEGFPLHIRRKLHHLDTFQKNMGLAFSEFINQAKETVCADHRIVIYIDGIESLAVVNGKSILDYFHQPEDWANGVYVIATTKLGVSLVGEDAADPLEIPAKRITIRQDEPRYRRFLRMYFYHFIDPLLSEAGIADTKSVFAAIQPQTVLIFSLYHRILTIYLADHPGRKGNAEDVGSLEAIIRYYFNVLETRYSRETFTNYKELLYLLSISSSPLDQEDMQYLIQHRFLKKNYLDESDPTSYLFRVFTRAVQENGERCYLLLHNGITRMIRFEWSLSNAVNGQLIDSLISLLDRKRSDLKGLFEEGKTLLAFARPLLESDDVEPEEKSELLLAMSILPFEAGWDKDATFRKSEETVLRIISELGWHVLPAVRRAKCLSVLGNDLYIDGKIAESSIILQQALESYRDVSPTQMTQEELYDYQELKSLIATCAQALGDHETAVQMYEALVKDLQFLFERHYIRVDACKYVRNIACLGHVYGHAKMFDAQIRTLNRAEELCGQLHIEDPAIKTFISFGKAYYFHDTQAYRTAFETATGTIASYLQIRKTNKEQFYYGNILDCFRLLFDTILSAFALFTEQEVENSIRQYSTLKQLQMHDGEYHYFYNINADEALARVLYCLGRIDAAQKLCRKTVRLIERNQLDIDDEYFMRAKLRIAHMESNYNKDKENSNGASTTNCEI